MKNLSAKARKRAAAAQAAPQLTLLQQKREPLIRVHLDADEIVADNFAGGGGASTGIEWALGRSPDIAINHDDEAIAMHRANHPTTEHYLESVWDVDPLAACAGRKVGLAWFSPDCKHFSKAKGTVPREQKIRGLAWSAVRWAQLVKPRVICLENVEEFKDWGPLDRKTGLPRKDKKGVTFRAFVRKLERLGYVVEWRLLRAHDYGAPTSRRRFFMIARCDGAAITWPEPTHGPGRAKPYRTAAECIDWSVAAPSIFDRERPLAEKTLRRIARGIQKFVLANARPFIVPVNHGDKGQPDGRSQSIDAPLTTVTSHGRGSHAVVTPMLVRYNGERRDGEKRGASLADPLPTQDTSNRYALVAPYLVHRSNGERPAKVKPDGSIAAAQAPRIYDIEQPLGTVMAQGQKHALVTAFLAKHNGGNNDRNGRMSGSALDVPTDTVTSRDSKALTVAHLVRYQGNGAPQSIEQPLGTQTTKDRYGLVSAFLMKYYGTSTGSGCDEPVPTITAGSRKAKRKGTGGHQALVTVVIDGETYVIADIGMRMLTPRELFKAQGFDESYDIDAAHVRDGKPLTKTAQVKMCGNSVPPPVTAAIVRALFAERAATDTIKVAPNLATSPATSLDCSCDHCTIAREVGAPLPEHRWQRQLKLQLAAQEGAAA